MNRVRSILKTTLLICFLFFAKLRGHSNKPAILMYHSFDREGWRYGVSPKQLKKQLEYLSKHREFVSLNDIIDHASGKTVLPNYTISITIDDGYEDTYSVFFPLAQKYNIPFALFLTTDLSERENFGNLKRPTWEQLREMHESGLMTIGLHGHTHKYFTDVVQSGLVSEEIEQSEQIIERELGVRPKVAAYPSGRQNKDVIHMLKERGYRAALSIRSGFVEPGDDLFLLRRVEVSRHISYRMFVLRLTPALSLYNSFVSRVNRLLGRRGKRAV